MLIAVVVGLSPTALAVTHGHAHEHAHEHEIDTRQAMSAEGHVVVHHDDASHDSHEHGLDTEGVQASAGDDGGDATHSLVGVVGERDQHAHPRVDTAAAARADVRLNANVALRAPAPAVLTLPPEQQSLAARLLDVAPARAGPTGTPPPRLRAPPVR